MGLQVKPASFHFTHFTSDLMTTLVVSHHESIVHLDDVTAKQRGLQFGHLDGPALPHVAHPRNYVVSSHRRQLLTQHLHTGNRTGHTSCPMALTSESKG